jgi:hypothetical protein
MHSQSSPAITPRLTVEMTRGGVQHVTVRVRNAGERAAGLQFLHEALPALTEVDRLVRRHREDGSAG